MKQAILGNEIAAFRCQGCDVRLVKKTARIVSGASAFVFWFFVKERYGWDGWQTWAAAAAVSAILAVIALTATHVRLATADDPDRPPNNEQVRDGPPPLDPTFRGMSGPTPSGPASKDPDGG